MAWSTSGDALEPTLTLTPSVEGEYFVELRALGHGVDRAWTQGPYDPQGAETVAIDVVLPDELTGAAELQVLAVATQVDPETGAIVGSAQAARARVVAGAWADDDARMAAAAAADGSAVADGEETVDDGSSGWEVTP